MTLNAVQNPYPPAEKALYTFASKEDLAPWSLFSDATLGGDTHGVLEPCAEPPHEVRVMFRGLCFADPMATQHNLVPLKALRHPLHACVTVFMRAWTCCSWSSLLHLVVLMACCSQPLTNPQGKACFRGTISTTVSEPTSRLRRSGFCGINREVRHHIMSPRLPQQVYLQRDTICFGCWRYAPSLRKHV